MELFQKAHTALRAMLVFFPPLTSTGFRRLFQYRSARTLLSCSPAQFLQVSVFCEMATSPTRTLSPLPSRGDGLGIFPSGDSLSRSSTYSYGHTRSSTCTDLSFSQHHEQGTNQPTTPLTRTTATRTNLKEIQKSPIPHRFNLVPSSKKRPQDRATMIPRSMTQWTRKVPPEFMDEGRILMDPSLYEVDSVRGLMRSVIESLTRGNQSQRSLKPVTTEGEEQHSILEELISDAFDSPVFDCLSTPSPNAACASSEQRSPASFTPSSFTLVQDQPSHKARRVSATLDSIPKGSSLSSSENSQLPKCYGRQQEFHSAASTSTPLSEADIHHFQDSASGSVVSSQNDYDAKQKRAPLSAADRRHPSKHSKCRSASSSSMDSFVGGRPDTSASVYSQPSGYPYDSLDSLATSKSATQDSLASSDSRHRRFAARRRAIYAEYGFDLAFPDSDSSSSIRHTHIPTSSSKTFTGKGSNRTASAYVPLRSAWSASTSAASVRSQLQDPANGGSADEQDSLPLNLPFSSSINLAYLANDKLERFSVQDSILNSSRNPLLEDQANFTTSTPAAKTRAHRSLAKLALDSLPDVPALPDAVKRSTRFQLYSSRFELQPWAPLQVAKLGSDSGSIFSQSSSTLERAQMFVKQRDDLDYHPIVKQLMDDVDQAILEWGRGCPVVAA